MLRAASTRKVQEALQKRFEKRDQAREPSEGDSVSSPRRC